MKLTQQERDRKTARIRSIQEKGYIFVCEAKDRGLTTSEQACEDCDCITGDNGGVVAMNAYMELLGRKCRDMVTGFEGVVESIAYDLYGCVQVVLRPTVDKDKKHKEGAWFDVKRLKVLSDKPVMPVPAFNRPGAEVGPAEKPAFTNRQNYRP